MLILFCFVQQWMLFVRTVLRLQMDDMSGIMGGLWQGAKDFSQNVF